MVDKDTNVSNGISLLLCFWGVGSNDFISCRRVESITSPLKIFVETSTSDDRWILPMGVCLFVLLRDSIA